MPEFSLIIPVFNRPKEVDELLQSLTDISEKEKLEIIIVEDGSDLPAEQVIKDHRSELNISYYYKENSGPGLTRNYGADKATGEWLIFLDSDCLIPKDYIKTLAQTLDNQTFDFFGGPDKAHSTFKTIQKAINYSMTSFLTTGGIRGGRSQLEKFKPRSFNMGIKAEAFRDIGGFADLRFGEDLDLSLRLESKGYKAQLVPEAFVYHKRRSTLGQFFKQVFNSGVARVYLSKIHPGSLKLVHLLPPAFTLYLFASAVFSPLFQYPLIPISLLIIAIFIHSTIANKSLLVGLISVISSLIQLTGYGIGFLYSFIRIYILKLPVKFGFQRNFYGTSSGKSSN